MDETGIADDRSNDEVESTGWYETTWRIKCRLKPLVALIGGNHSRSGCWSTIERGKTMDDQAIISQNFHSLNDNLSTLMRQRRCRTIDGNAQGKGL